MSDQRYGCRQCGWEGVEGEMEADETDVRYSGHVCPKCRNLPSHLDEYDLIDPLFVEAKEMLNKHFKAGPVDDFDLTLVGFDLEAAATVVAALLRENARLREAVEDLKGLITAPSPP